MFVRTYIGFVVKSIYSITAISSVSKHVSILYTEQLCSIWFPGRYVVDHAQGEGCRSLIHHGGASHLLWSVSCMILCI